MSDTFRLSDYQISISSKDSGQARHGKNGCAVLR